MKRAMVNRARVLDDVAARLFRRARRGRSAALLKAALKVYAAADAAWGHVLPRSTR